MAIKSYLKYAGGKARILDQVLSTFPDKIEQFIEPFVGSATVALNVKADHKILYDVNYHVIGTHNMCKDNPHEVLAELEDLYALGRDAYYDLRDEFNSASAGVRQAALLIYLNKHGFNGLMRYNSDWNFNVPVGKSKTIHFPYEEIKGFGSALGNAYIGWGHFTEPMAMAEKGAVIYCDPPYVPASATLSDIKYTADGFGRTEQESLVEYVEEAFDRGCHVVVSNHDTEVTRELYKNATKIIEVEAFRSISRNGGERGKVGELLAIYSKG